MNTMVADDTMNAIMRAAGNIGGNPQVVAKVGNSYIPILGVESDEHEGAIVLELDEQALQQAIFGDIIPDRQE